ncbi:MAG: MarR family winged helix-turn-helix transcriptional regulator [Desulfovibrio sp.]|jgi:DNA-binding MarR family transcriptional regulator|nr:MarR family winged helix-turn-helix transcriptional regulator [Desulfovibrio sp.]
MANSEVQPTGCYCTTLRKAARALTKGYDKALEGTGLRITQYALLNHIHRMEPVSFQALSSAVALERTTLIRNLNLLCKQDFVHTNSGTRIHAIMLTEVGRAALEAARPYWRKAQDHILKTLSNEEQIFLNDLLHKLQNIFV